MKASEYLNELKRLIEECGDIEMVEVIQERPWIYWKVNGLPYCQRLKRDSDGDLVPLGEDKSGGDLYTIR